MFVFCLFPSLSTDSFLFLLALPLLGSIVLIYKRHCPQCLSLRSERQEQLDCIFRMPNVCSLIWWYSLPEGISSILIPLVNHPLSGTWAMIKSLKKERSTSWVHVGCWNIFEEAAGITENLLTHAVTTVSVIWNALNTWAAIKEDIFTHVCIHMQRKQMNSHPLISLVTLVCCWIFLPLDKPFPELITKTRPRSFSLTSMNCEASQQSCTFLTFLAFSDSC